MLIPLTPRWTTLREHGPSNAYWESPHRFNVVHAGRRSYKTEKFKRKLVRRALGATTTWEPRFFAAAPTRDQAKRIYWDDLKALVAPAMLGGRPSESELMIPLVNGAQIWVLGMDKPERIEGSPWDGGGLDEYGNMKSMVWTANVRPALSDRKGWCDFIGVPEGRNHYYGLAQAAKADMLTLGAKSDWGCFSWFSSDILDADEIESARHDLDPLTYQQEYEGSFINFEGRAYYQFLDANKAALAYDATKPIALCFDFNVDPGVCAVIQEQKLPHEYAKDAKGGTLLDRPIFGTGVIGEVWIPRNSNTPAVCRKIIADWGTHRGAVNCYGDATGGNRGTAKVSGSDWDLIKAELRPVFGDRLSIRVKSANPRERARINAVNTRLRNGAGEVHLLVDPSRAPHVVEDFEGVALLKGGSGEIDKKKSPALSHLSDGVGYYIDYEYPINSGEVQRVRMGGT